MMIIGVVSFATATLILFLPETLGRDLPQTLRQGENFGKDQSFWALPCCCPLPVRGGEQLICIGDEACDRGADSTRPTLDKLAVSGFICTSFCEL